MLNARFHGGTVQISKEGVGDQVGDTVLGSCIVLRRWGPAWGSRSLGVGLNEGV